MCCFCLCYICDVCLLCDVCVCVVYVECECLGGSITFYCPPSPCMVSIPKGKGIVKNLAKNSIIIIIIIEPIWTEKVVRSLGHKCGRTIANFSVKNKFIFTSILKFLLVALIITIFYKMFLLILIFF